MTPSPRADAATRFWRRRARWTAWRHSFGAVLGAFLPLCLAVSTAFACALLIGRQHGAVSSAWWIVYGAALLTTVAGSVFLARRRGFFTAAQARVRLEDYLGLHNRLSAAAAGVGAFPPPQAAPDGYAFRWERIAPPLAGAAVLVWAAAAVTISRPTADFVPDTLPTAVAQTAQWLDLLKKADLVQPAAVEEFHERLEQLRQQPARDWYSQGSLEAGDNLRGQTEQSLQALQRDLRNAAGSLETLEHTAGQTNPTEVKAAGDRLREAVKGLALGNLPLNKETLSQLQGIDPAAVTNLSPEQIDTLKQRLKSGAKTTEAMLRPGQPGEGPGADALAAAGKQQPGEPGGPGGGKDGSALDFHDKPVNLGSELTEGVTGSGDLEHALPGDLLGVGKGEHAVDPTAYQGPTSAGAVASEGTGGEAVWRDDLTPQEREVLRNFFK